jgi:polysaccharide pyruvyl transferase WcaK-like protein
MQIASHNTNIGDGANIDGFQRTFLEDARNSGIEVFFHDVEILDFLPHIGKKDFNSQEFIDFANQMDLIVIGGGGFFSAFPRFKNTGCHVDFTINTLDKIKAPIVYYALGFGVYYQQKYHNTDRLKVLLEYSQKNKNRILISLRNDGSYARMRDHLGNDSMREVSVIPDGGFYVRTENSYHPEITKDKINFGIQLAGDKASFRFKEKPSLYKKVINKVGGQKFEIISHENQYRILSDMAFVINELRKDYNLNVVIIPHIISDLKISQEFLSLLPLDFNRYDCSVSSVLRGRPGSRHQFDLYKNLQIVAGMRFHANVCSYALGTPVLGLVSHDQLDGLYNDLSDDSYVFLSSDNFKQEINSKLNELLQENPDERARKVEKNLERLRKTTSDFHQRIFKLL